MTCARTDRSIREIYVQPFPATGIKYQLFAKGSDSPHHLRWCRIADLMTATTFPITLPFDIQAMMNNALLVENSLLAESTDGVLDLLLLLVELSNP